MRVTASGRAALAGLLLAAVAAPADAQLASFQGLGFLDGELDSQVVDISADGSTVIGTSGTKGFRWRAGSRIQIPDNPAAVNGNGDAIVGSNGGPGLGGAWRWIRGYSHLLRTPGPPPNPISGPLIGWRAQAISDDGRFVWGVTLTDTSRAGLPFNPWFQAYRVRIGLEDWMYWALEDGCDHLMGFVFNQMEIGAISSDGSRMTMVEQCAKLGYPPSDTTRVWDHDGTSPQVAIVRDYTGLSRANASNADGTRVVGYQDSTAAYSNVSPGPPSLALRLHPIPGTSPLSSVANDVSGSGDIIVGAETVAAGDIAFWWSEGTGTRRLQDMVATPPGWTLTQAIAISRDGRVIAGNGVDPDGHPQAWIAAFAAEVPTLQAPLAWLGTALLATGAWLAVRRHRPVR